MKTKNIKLMIFSILGGVLVTAFMNCSKMEFAQYSDGSNSKVGADDGPAEVVSTDGMDGTELSDDNLDDIETELETRKRDRDTEIVITDAEGCGSNKVIICHIPPGNFSARHDICVGVSALKAHVDVHTAEGTSDYLGSCTD